MSIALPFDDLLGGLGGLSALTSLTNLGGLGGGSEDSGGGGLPGLSVLTNLLGGGGGLPLVGGLLDGGLLGGDEGLPLIGGLLGGGGGLPLVGGLLGGGGGLPLVGDLLGSLTGVLGGGAAKTDVDQVEASALGGLPLPTDLLGGLLGGDALGGGLALPGLSGGEGGNGSVFGTSDGLLGGLMFALESATFNVPVLGDVVDGVVRSGAEGGGVQNIALTLLLGTPLFEPVQSLIGGNSYGDELILYEPATAAVSLTQGIPVVGDLVREFATGSFPTSSAFIGSNLGGLLSEDFLQNFVSTGGTIGTVADGIEKVLANLPLANMVFDGNDINSTLDLITNATDQILYVDDLVAGALGGDALSEELPFDNALGGVLDVLDTAGLAAPVGELLYGALTPIATNLQEVAIAGPIVLGTLGKLM